MTWHAHPIVIHLRRYEDGKSFEARDKFASIATAVMLDEGRAFVSGFLNDGTAAPISRQDWQDLATLLREKYGVKRILSERRAAPREYNTGPAPL